LLSDDWSGVSSTDLLHSFVDVLQVPLNRNPGNVRNQLKIEELTTLICMNFARLLESNALPGKGSSMSRD
jgi:hypothetical protein